MENRLNEEGFIMQYLISGLREEPFIDHTADENQLRYEKYLRSILTIPQTKEPQDRVKLNETGDLGLPWRYYYNYGNWFVDLSTFYSVLTRVEIDAYTQLKVKEDVQVKLWYGLMHRLIFGVMGSMYVLWLLRFINPFRSRRLFLT